MVTSVINTICINAKMVMLTILMVNHYKITNYVKLA